MLQQLRQIGMVLSILWLSALSCRPLFGVDPSLRIDQLHHTSWTQENAGIGEIKQVVQTSDGFLWLKTSTLDLLRFDGVRFETIETALVGTIPVGEHRWDDIYSIAAAPDGGLWIGHDAPIIDLVKNGRVQSFTPQNGLPSAPIDKIVSDRDGVLWIATRQGLSRLQGTHCILIGLDWGYTGGVPSAILSDKDGTLWVMSHDGRLFFLEHGAKKFAINIGGSDVGGYDSFLSQAPDGVVWESSHAGLRRVLRGSKDQRGSGTSVLDPHIGPTQFLFDRDGTLWIELLDGLYRVLHPERLKPWRSKSDGQISLSPPAPGSTDDTVIRAFTTKQGLSSEIIWSLFEDREGNIWAGTGAGLDRFRSNSFIRAPLPPTRQEQFALAAGDHGTIWAANWDSPLFQIGDGSLVTHQFADGNTSALYRDPSGTIWVGKTGESIWHSGVSGFVSISLPVGKEQDYVNAMAMDRTGRLWVSTASHGVFSLTDRIWKKENERLRIPNGIPVQAMAVDDRGRIWFDTGALTVLDGQSVQQFGIKNGIKRGYATAIEVRGEHTWMGGAYGLALLTYGHFQVLKGSGGEVFEGTTGIVERSNGDLWLNTISGVVHITSAELQKVIGAPNYQVQFERFDSEDGLDGSANYWIPVPTVAMGLDGELWFSTNKGIFKIDPEKIARDRNSVAPPVFVNAVTFDGRRLPIIGEVKLPAKTESIQIDYTAPSLTMPGRVKFRYLLDGIDRDWQDAGTRRQAYYTNLPPGSYQFRVIASNSDGIWNQSGAMMRFNIAAAWYQTLWFKCLCVVVSIGVLWSLYVFRLARATAEINERLNERIKERERIARDLHDTLLQGFQGLMLHFQAAMNLISKSHPAHSAMEKALGRADQVLLQGRESVRNLRFESLTNSDLAGEFELCAEECSHDESVEFGISTIGSPRALQPIIRDDVLKIGREALLNAFKHSHASKIEVEITYAHSKFQIRVRDNGNGIDAKILESGRPGHWGLLGMRERANQIGGDLNIWNSPVAGVEIELTIPSKIAYRP